MKPKPLEIIKTRRYICTNKVRHIEEVVDVPEIKEQIDSAVEWLLEEVTQIDLTTDTGKERVALRYELIEKIKAAFPTSRFSEEQKKDKGLTKNE